MKQACLTVAALLFLAACATEQSGPQETSADLTATADATLEAIQASDFASLSHHVHKTRGLSFSPYTTDLQELSTITFARADVANFPKDEMQHLWGYHDGIGTPISLTPKEYFKSFVYDVDFRNETKAEIMDSEQVKSAPDLGALYRAYPDSTVVQYRYEGTKETGFKDFRDLYLIFSQIDGRWYLIGMSHGESTL